MASLCFRTSVVFALVAAGLALWMTATHDYRALHAEVVLFVLGWGSFMAYGLYYRTIAAAAAGLAKLHYVVALVGVIVEAIGIIGHGMGQPVLRSVPHHRRLHRRDRLRAVRDHRVRNARDRRPALNLMA